VERLNILVFGAGAIGTYVGGSLALTGNQVAFIEQAQAVAELRERGLHLDLRLVGKPISSVGDPSVRFFQSLDEALRSGPYDFAVFALKSFDTSSALEVMKPLAVQLPPVLCLSNGVENESAMAAVLGSEKVIAGTVTSSVGRRSVGDIVLERRRGLGVADGQPLSLFIAEALNAAGLNARLLHQAVEMKWSKMLTNLPANASAAILDMTAAEVFNHPGLFRLEMRMLQETLTVMRAHHIRVVDLPGVPVRALALGARLPAFLSHSLMKRAIGGGRGRKMPSFHIDLYRGRGKSEVEWLNGAVVRYGQRAGVKTPVNKILTGILVNLTKGELPLQTYAHQPDKLLAQVSDIH
jgi:2-dehydropantoate 2-reductase